MANSQYLQGNKGRKEGAKPYSVRKDGVWVMVLASTGQSRRSLCELKTGFCFCGPREEKLSTTEACIC